MQYAYGFKQCPTPLHLKLAQGMLHPYTHSYALLEKKYLVGWPF
jgi:hypothetical protein